MIYFHATIAPLITREYPDGSVNHAAVVKTEVSERTHVLTPEQYRVAKAMLPHALVMSLAPEAET